MDREHLKIGFVRRGFSQSGGAEAYLKRLAAGLRESGHETQLITTDEWPPNEWPFGPIARLAAKSPLQFADVIEASPPRRRCDVLLSLERIWRCDVYRAGDGVHRTWLQRRSQAGGLLARLSRAFNRKHESILRLEESLFVRGGAGRVIANSEMVKREITALYGYPAERIDVVYNGVPLAEFRPTPERRAAGRAKYKLTDSETAVLFVGSGWERKGLRATISAVEAFPPGDARLLVAGRGDAQKYQSRSATFLGEVRELPELYAAADVFVLTTLYDPFSNACLEALASGLPVITTSANGFAEVIEDGVHGSVVPASDPDALRAALAFWFERDRRAAARPRILERAADFAIERNVARTLEVLLAAAESRN